VYKGYTISAVIPCYNEEEGIQKVLRDMPSFVDEVVVVDNNSTDNTGEVAKSLGAKVVFEPKRGYGSAYKAGLGAASKDIVVTLDGDGTYPTEAIAGLIDAMVEKGLDFISACRFPLENKEAMSFRNYIGNKILTWVMCLLFFRYVKDSQSGMWLFKGEILPKLKLTSGGMSFSEEIKIEAIRNKGIKFGEIHIPYRARIGEVKLSAWKDGIKNLAFLFKKRFGL